MREYELTYLVSDDVAEADLKKITDKVAGFITSGGGKVSKEESWGRRKLAYPIEKKMFATYITVWFEIEAAKLTELDHELRVFPQIIRHLVTLKVEKSEVLKVTKEDIVDTAEVEKVIGEKSFEVVEGETEASKDLMAVRETAAEDKEVQEDKDDSTTLTEGTQIDTDGEKSEIRNPKSETKEEKTETKKIKPKTEKKVIKAKKVEKPVEESKEAEDDPSRQGEAEADRIKKLDEKLDELLKDEL